MTAQFFEKTWGNGPKISQKLGFLNWNKKMVINFHRICPIMKIFISCCIPEKLLCEKSYSSGIGQSALSQSDCRIFKSFFSLDQIDEIVLFLSC